MECEPAVIKVKRGAAAQRRPARSERKNRAFFPRSDRPYVLKCNAFQTEKALGTARFRRPRPLTRSDSATTVKGKYLFPHTVPRKEFSVSLPDIRTIRTYGHAYEKTRLTDKLRSCLTLLGVEGLRNVLRLYYTLKKPDLPVRARAVILGALGYFILPVDALPDFLPIVGLTDDLGVLAAAAAAVIMYMDDEVKARADAKLERLLGR